MSYATSGCSAQTGTRVLMRPVFERRPAMRGRRVPISGHGSYQLLTMIMLRHCRAHLPASEITQPLE